MIRGKYLSKNDDLREVINIRRKVLGVTNDNNDDLAMHALVFEDDTPVASGRMCFDGITFTMADIAVLPEYQHKGYGEFTLRLLADRVLVCGGAEINLTCNKSLVPFFERYSFHIVTENEDTISMKLILSELKSPCGGHCH